MQLNLLNCHRVTDGGVAAIAAGCPNLRALDLYACDKVTDQGVAAIREGCPRLAKLDLGRCYQVTDASLHAIGARPGVNVWAWGSWGRCR